MPMERYDVAVAGLGVMGAAASFQLAARGLRTIGFDRWTTPHTQGSSHGESRIIRQAYYEDPAYVPLARRSLELWRELEAASGRDLLRRTGALMIGDAEGVLVQGALRSAESQGVPHERLSADQVRSRFPGLAPTDGMEAVYESDAGVLRAEECVEALLDAAAAAGAELRHDDPVVAWESDGHEVRLLTRHGRYRAGTLVLALGSWLPELVPGLRLFVRRQTVLWFLPVPDPAPFAPDRCPPNLWEPEPGSFFYAVPDLGRGVKIGGHYDGSDARPETVSRRVTHEDTDPARRLLERYLPGANGPLLRGSVCLYTNTPDRHFVVDRHPDQHGVLVLSACSGHGFKFGPVLGEAIADLVLEGRSRHDIGLFSLARVTA